MMRKSYLENTPLLLRLISPVQAGPAEKVSEDFIKPYFILSSGRTGTNFLANYFDQYNEVYAVHEPSPSWRLRLWSHAYYLGRVNDRQMCKILHSLRSEVLSTLNQPIYLESNPFMTGFAGAIDDVFENATIIHIVRDPRDYIRSSMNHGNASGLKGFMNKFVPYWYTDVSEYVDEFENTEMMYRIAGYWKFANDFLSKTGEKAQNYQVYRFEELFDDNNSGLREMAAFFGVAYKDIGVEKTNQSKRNLKLSWGSWTDEEIQRVNDICSPTMQKFNYGNEPEWKGRLK